MPITKNQFKKFLFWYSNLILLISVSLWAWQIFDVVPRLLKNGLSKIDIFNHIIFILNPLMPFSPIMSFSFIYMLVLLFSVVLKHTYNAHVEKIVFSSLLVTVWELVIIFLWAIYEG